MTFLELINAVLREVNEVELTTIGSSRGIQTSVKDFINKSQRDIINSEVEWPFTIVSTSFTTTASTAEYTPPASVKTIDFDTFTVQESATTAERSLSYLSFNEYIEHYYRRSLQRCLIEDQRYHSQRLSTNLPRQCTPDHRFVLRKYWFGTGKSKTR